MEIKVGEFYKTRDGKKVKIYSTEGHARFPIHGATLHDNFWYSNCWTASGEFQIGADSPDDLMEPWMKPVELPQYLYYLITIAGAAIAYADVTMAREVYSPNKHIYKGIVAIRCQDVT